MSLWNGWAVYVTDPDGDMETDAAVVGRFQTHRQANLIANRIEKMAADRDQNACGMR